MVNNGRRPRFWPSFVGVILALLLPTCVMAQFDRLFKKDTISSRYYETNDTLLNTRIYASQKFTYPTILNKDGTKEVKYRANANNNLGVGATYGWLTINIGLNFKFINHDNDKKGETNFLDLHFVGIGKSYYVDFYGQFYNGAYLLPESGEKPPKGEPYLQRPDIYTQQFGISGWYIPNWRRYSYAATVNQRDWQKKSAGSPLLGWEIFSGRIQGDSNLVPKNRAEGFVNPLIDKVNLVQMGVGVGYAYTLVIQRHLFISATATASFNGGFTREYVGDKNQGGVYFRPSYLIRPSFGYNSKKFNCSVMLFASQLRAGDNYNQYHINTGNLRFTLAYRMAPRDRNKKFINDLIYLNPYWKRQHPQ